jgi:hypothetical protein
MQELSREDEEDAFREIGEIPVRDGKIAEIAVYRGAAILLQFEASFRTADVDASVDGGDHGALMAPAARVAERRGWLRSWLSEAVTVYDLLDEFLDAFYTETDGSIRQAMIGDEPPRLGDERRDAYVGAVAEHLARRWGLRIPPWSAAPWREVSEPWFVGMMGKGLSGLFLVESPIAFRRRLIYTEAEPLRRARMPLA